MKSNPEYDQTRVEFEDEWSRSKIEDLIGTNDYKRARQERNLYEKYLPKNELILEAGCGLGPKIIYFKKYLVLFFFDRETLVLYLLFS